MLYPIQNKYRNKLDLSSIWDFKTDPEAVGETNGWANRLEDSRPIAVPGSWNEQYADLFGYLDLAWYLKRIDLPRSWQGQRIFLRVGSANYLATVYVNGEKADSHEGGHLPFAFEITQLIRWDGENAIALSVENELRPARVPPGNLPGDAYTSLLATTPKTTFDFYPFAGIHRPVVLYTVPGTHIEDITIIPGLDGQAGKLEVGARLNAQVSRQGTVLLHDSSGRLVTGTELAFRDGAAQAHLEVPGARLWSDKDPYLYTLTVQTEDDAYTLKAGIRTISVKGGKILLNGQPVHLNGFGRHEDFPASGKGLNLPLIVKDYDLMRWTGANAYRTSHYPYSEEEMQLADLQGFLIIDEIPAVGLQMRDEANNPERLRTCLQQIDELIARDKNHPAVLMWSVANEPVPAPPDASGLETKLLDEANLSGKLFLDTEIARVKELDPNRLATFAAAIGTPLSWLENCDVICINRYYGWYIDGGQPEVARHHLEQELDQLWDRFQKPIIMTEFGADTIAGYHGHPSLMWTEEYQANLIRLYLEVAAERDFIAGMQVWNFADFLAVQSTGRVGGMNHKGIFTRARQPKMAVQVLREFWTNRS